MELRIKPKLKGSAGLRGLLETHGEMLSKIRAGGEVEHVELLKTGEAVRDFIEALDELLEEQNLPIRAPERSIRLLAFPGRDTLSGAFNSFRKSIPQMEHLLKVKMELAAIQQGKAGSGFLVEPGYAGKGLRIKLLPSRGSSKFNYKTLQAEAASGFVDSQLSKHAGAMRTFLEQFVKHVTE